MQLTLCQDLQLSGEVIVTTPSKLAVRDAQKGIEMFISMGVSTLVVVENMTFFECEGGGRHYPFGSNTPDASALYESLGLNSSSNLFRIPISSHQRCQRRRSACLPRPSPLRLHRTGYVREDCRGGSRGVDKDKAREEGEWDGDAVVRLGEVGFRVADVQLVVVEREGEVFVVRLFSDMGATEVRVEGDKLRSRRWRWSKRGR